MATEQEKAAVRRWFVEGTNPAIFDEVLAPDVVMYMKGMEQPLKGVEAVKQLGTTMGTAFPDLLLTVDQMTDRDDTITVHWMGQGTHTGDLRLPTGSQLCLQPANGSPLLAMTPYGSLAGRS